MKKFSAIAFAFFILVLLPLPLACRTMTVFERAAINGAYANIDVLVLDELNAPIKNAQVDIRFGMLNERKSTKTTVFTDENGHATTSGLTCGHDVQIVTSHPEYYSSRKKLCFVALGNEFEVRGRQWLPEKMEHTLRMRKIRNPIRLNG